MKVKEIMHTGAEVANPDETVQDAAAAMERIDAGFLPVGENDRLIGMITDRDIAIRCVGRGLGPQTSIREVMTPEVRYCFEDDNVDEVSRNMSELQIRRLPVVNSDKRLVGILSLGDLAKREQPQTAGAVLRHVAQPGGKHVQTLR